jgi:predicted MPP superfamily phosphohydrolase
MISVQRQDSSGDICVLLGKAPVPEKDLIDRRLTETEDRSVPRELGPWPVFRASSGNTRNGSRREIRNGAIRCFLRNKLWLWPERRICFFSDLHADPGAFMRSLELAGLARRDGNGPIDFGLTEAGQSSLIIIGGDCLNKGPNNLALLDMISHLKQLGAEVILLAGNHDVRILVGMLSAASPDQPRVGHYLARMGKQSIAFFREVLTLAIEEKLQPISLMREREARDKLFPNKEWYRAFPEAVRGVLTKKAIERELRSVQERTLEFEITCHGHGMSLAHVVAALEVGRSLFLTPGGRYHWFYDQMKLLHREGAHLFLHAGLDDGIAEQLTNESLVDVNAEFRRLLSHDPLTLYGGPIGNVFRTRYKPFDHTLTKNGVRAVHGAGIYAVFHGHRRSLEGQRALFRDNLLHFECDVSLDSNTRRKEGLTNPGGAVTLIEPEGRVLGLSTDSPFIKEFNVAEHAGLLTHI